jgi:hypothetical protein
MSSRNTADLRAVLGFNSGAFEPGADAQSPSTFVKRLTRDEIDQVCPRYWEVQSIMNQAAASTDRGAYPTPQAYGTEVHQKVKEEVNGPATVPPSPPRDPDFKAEVSFIKSQAAEYGDPGSKRVDVYENPHTGTVCVYDIKTGDTGLGFARMQELAYHVGNSYPGTRQIIVTEVKPAK